MTKEVDMNPVLLGRMIRGFETIDVYGYTDTQMQAAILAERERCAKVVESAAEYKSRWFCEHIAKAIRIGE